MLRLIPGKGFSEKYGVHLDKVLEKDKHKHKNEHKDKVKGQEKDYSDRAHINSMDQGSGHSMGIPRDNDDGVTDAGITGRDNSASSASSSSSSSSSSTLPCDAYFYALSSLRPSAVQGTSHNTPSQY